MLSPLLIAYAIVLDVVTAAFDFINAVFSQPQSWATLAGVLAPTVIAVVNRPGTHPWVRRTVAYVTSVAIGLFTVSVAGQLNPQDVLTSVALVITASEVAYRKFWKPRGYAAVIEHATSPSSATDGGPDLYG